MNQVIARMFGDFGELAVEGEFLIDPANADPLTVLYVEGPTHFFLNGLEITEERAREIVDSVITHTTRMAPDSLDSNRP